jgi:hypothetical protein
MPANIQDTAFRKIVEALYDEQKSLWSNERKDNSTIKAADKLKSMINSNWKELGDSEIDSCLLKPKIIDFPVNKTVMYLPPLEKETSEFLAVMSIKYDPTQNDLAIHIMLITNANQGQVHLPYKSVGFRIESPHKPINADAGRHKFYHSQLINSLNYGPWTSKIVETIDWLPLHQPSFPLWATNPVEAVLCLILTVYGRLYYLDFFKRHSAKFIKGIESDFKILNTKLMA